MVSDIPMLLAGVSICSFNFWPLPPNNQQPEGMSLRIHKGGTASTKGYQAQLSHILRRGRFEGGRGQFGETMEVYYIPWNCRCCKQVNTSAESCDCSQKGLRHDPMKLDSVRLCSICRQCSIHCPWNHTQVADGGWGTSETVFISV
jgi:hypothetical protein